MAGGAARGVDRLARVRVAGAALEDRIHLLDTLLVAGRDRGRPRQHALGEITQRSVAMPPQPVGHVVRHRGRGDSSALHGFEQPEAPARATRQHGERRLLRLALQSGQQVRNPWPDGLILVRRQRHERRLAQIFRRVARCHREQRGHGLGRANFAEGAHITQPLLGGGLGILDQGDRFVDRSRLALPQPERQRRLTGGLNARHEFVGQPGHRPAAKRLLESHHQPRGVRR